MPVFFDHLFNATDRENFYEGDVWTNGHGIYKNINYSIKDDDRYLVIHTNGYHIDKSNILKVIIDGTEANFYNVNENYSYLYELPSGTKNINQVDIISTTFIPKDIGLNEDSRVLGIDIKNITIEN
jgi:hypothetical protein